MNHSHLLQMSNTSENIQPGNISGMGPISLPNNGKVGSGDVPSGRKKNKKKKKKMKIRTYEEFASKGSVNEEIDINDDMDGGEEGWNKLTKRKYDFKSKLFDTIKFKLDYANVYISEDDGGDAEYKITFEGDNRLNGYVYSQYIVGDEGGNWEVSLNRKVEISIGTKVEFTFDEDNTFDLEEAGYDTVSNSLSSCVDLVKEKLDNATVSYIIN